MYRLHAPTSHLAPRQQMQFLSFPDTSSDARQAYEKYHNVYPAQTNTGPILEIRYCSCSFFLFCTAACRCSLFSPCHLFLLLFYSATQSHRNLLQNVFPQPLLIALCNKSRRLAITYCKSELMSSADRLQKAHFRLPVAAHGSVHVPPESIFTLQVFAYSIRRHRNRNIQLCPDSHRCSLL